MPRPLAPLAVFLAALTAAASAQTVDVTFRFIPDLTPPPIAPVERAFLPGSFNDWGPNSGGQISTGAPSQMTFDEASGEYRYTQTLTVGQDGFYKVHYHRNASGSEFQWITDPLATTPCTFGSFGDDCRVTASDPMAFQPARQQNAAGEIVSVSAGFFGSEAFTDVQFVVNEQSYGLADGIADIGDGIYRLVLPEPVPPGAYFLARATDQSGDVAEASIGRIPPDVTDRAVPEGIADGITTLDDGTTYLVLRAPAKSYVYVLGSFNGWTETDDGLMFRDTSDPRGTRWWVEVDGLTSGQEVLFTYLVDGTVEVADPYSPVVYYPGEAPHPGGNIGFAVGAFTAGGSAFEWTDDDWAPPAQEDLVVYELLVRDFLRDHSFTSLTDTLDYLQRLGVNAVELMPVSEFDGDESWGYNPAFHLALDKYYGTPDEFKAFVDEAHSRGIAVILDVVYNHATGQSPLIRLYNSGGFSGPTDGSPYANVTARHPFNVFTDLNHESELTQIWLDAANRWWIDEYHVDGFRYDLSKGFTQRQSNSVGAWNAYDQSRVDLLTRMADVLWEAHPDAYVILEHLGENREERELADYRRDEGKGMMLWRKMNREYSQGSMGYPTANDFPSTLTGTYPPNVNLPVAGAITYMESHDEQWMMDRNLRYGNRDLPGYDIRQLHTALERQKLAAAFFFTVPGPRMMWQFGELGYGGGPGECLYENGTSGECQPGTPDRVGDKPIRWDYWSADATPFPGAYGGSLPAAGDRERELRQKLYRTWAALINVRQDYDLFHDVDTQVDLQVGLRPDRFIRLQLADAPSGQPTEAVVFGNFGVTETSVTLTFDTAGTWYDFFADTETTLQAGSHTFSLLPGEFRIWTDVDVPSPEPGLITVDTDDTPVLPPTEGLVSVFPNPTASQATATLVLDQTREVQLDVFDALGRRVATLAEGTYPSGSHAFTLDATDLPAGVYFVRYGWDTLPVTVTR